MEKIVVSPSGGQDRSYSVLVGASLLDKGADWVKGLSGNRAFIVGDACMSASASRLAQVLKGANWKVERSLLPVSEKTKDYRKIFPLYAELIKKKMDRQSVIFALGGGVIGDISGFVAGTYLRGIRWVGVPSTLLAQVDSSIGGKTGVNHPLGKNLIGLFHQPSLVLCDTDLLKSLSERDRVSGFGEMVKCGLTFDKNFYEFLAEYQTNIVALESKYLDIAIVGTLRQKADVVRQDEYERTGLRQLLNFGHTMGHALETATEYRRYRHGEAVLWGIRLEMALSVIRGHLPEATYQSVANGLTQLVVPALPKDLSVKKLLSGLKRDKKVKDGKVNFILLQSVGKAIVDNAVEDSQIAEAWKMVLKGESKK